ncbi:SRPBCC family protein [Arthrobacter castelli]|uniref:SRPBCC family protein n=1 Tax=Arthrobacter castelli TaxID=271431 RepID=UPI000403185A|nr:SRPBCC domain-containing protein [Arthrobacter castelli]
MGEFSTSIEIDAAPEVVFEYLVTDAGMTAWMGQWAQLDARPGGSFAVNIAGYPIRGEYLEVDRPHRVVVSWGAVGNPDLPPGTSIVEFSLTPAGSGTRVDLTHKALPDVDMPGHADGWAHFLPRLKIAATGGDAGSDTWTPT